MSDTLKTIAEFMGWEYRVDDCGPYCRKYTDIGIGTSRKDHYPTASRDDLQLVIEKIAEHGPLLIILLYRFKAEAHRTEGCKHWLLLPTQTLADICAAVIGETK